MFSSCCMFIQAVAMWPETIKIEARFSSVTLLPSDSTICEWSPVQHPVYSLCETGSQRDGEIAEKSSPALRKQTQFVFCSAFVFPSCHRTANGFYLWTWNVIAVIAAVDCGCSIAEISCLGRSLRWQHDYNTLYSTHLHGLKWSLLPTAKCINQYILPFNIASKFFILLGS